MHGVLHLFGYDHETDAEAEEMEAGRAAHPCAALPFPTHMRNTKRQAPDGDERRTHRLLPARTGGARLQADSDSPSSFEPSGPSTPASTRGRERPTPAVERLTSFFRPAQRLAACARTSPTRWPKATPTRPPSRRPSGRCSTTSCGFREVRVEDVMVPRADIEAVEIDTTLGELMQPVRAVRPFAHAGLRRDARRSARHGAYPRRRRPHHPRAPAASRPKRDAQAATGARRRSTSPRSTSPGRSASSA